MTNDYYDFNPGAAIWAFMLTGIVVFVVALCVLLIYFISRSEADSTGRPHLVRGSDGAPAEARGKATNPARPTRWTAATHGRF